MYSVDAVPAQMQHQGSLLLNLQWAAL
jgi:hypothetical protein